MNALTSLSNIRNARKKLKDISLFSLAFKVKINMKFDWYRILEPRCLVEDEEFLEPKVLLDTSLPIGSTPDIHPKQDHLYPGDFNMFSTSFLLR